MSEEENAVPSNIRAEQALLGILLYDNAAFERVPSAFDAGHFHDVFHQRLYAAMVDAISRGVPAEPLMLMERFKHDEAFSGRGGVSYLADLLDKAPASEHTTGYAMVVRDLALRRGLIALTNSIAGKADQDRETPAMQLIEDAEQQLFAMTADKTERGFSDFGSVLGDVIAQAAEAYQNEDGPTGISTGLVDLDKKLHGLHPGNLIYLAGRTGQGKTSLAVNIGLHVARGFHQQFLENGDIKVHGGRVGLFSLEMPESEVGRRMLAEYSGISGERIKAGDFDVSEFGRMRDAAMELQTVPFYTDDQGGISLAQIATRARRLKRTVGLELLIIDYLQLMATPPEAKQRHEGVAANSRGLKALAKELHIPIIVLSQVSRDVDKREDKRPRKADLRESGSIEEDADAIIFVYRHEYYLEKDKPKEGTPEFLTWEDELLKAHGKAELIIDKNRHGREGTVKVAFNAELTKFSNLV